MTEPVRDVQGRQLDQIRLLGVRGRGHHGVHPHERREGQEFSADVVVHVDTRGAASGDDLSRTISYAELAEDVTAVLTGPPVDLLETLAARIAEVGLAHEMAHAVDVVVHKPQAPLSVPFQDVQVHIRRYRAELPLQAAVGASEEPAAAPAPSAPVPAPPTSAPAPSAPVPAPPTPAPAPPAPEPVPPAPAPPPGDEPDPLLAPPHAPVDVALALGANLGDALATLRSAVAELHEADGVEVTGVSPLARTAAQLDPDQEPQPDYLNAVVLARTVLAPRELLALAHRIEAAHGRERTGRWAPRTLDIDVLTVDEISSEDPSLTLPHPRAHHRAFVLLPWAQIDPTATIPGQGSVNELAEQAPDRPAVRWLALDWLTRDPAGTGPATAEGA